MTSLILRSLGETRRLCFPISNLDAVQLRDFSARFGHIQRSVTGQAARSARARGRDLSNIIENGQPIGLGGCRAGLAHGHVVQRHRRIRERAVRSQGADARRPGACATLFANTQAPTRISPGAERAAQEHDCRPRFQQVLGEDAHSPRSIRPPLTEAQRKSRPPQCTRFFSRTPLPAAPCSTAIRATPHASMSSMRPQVIACWSSCSRTSCKRSTSTRTREGQRSLIWITWHAAQCHCRLWPHDTG